MASFRLLSDAFLAAHPAEAAAAIEELQVADAAAFLAEIPAEPASRVLSHMVATFAGACLGAMPQPHGAAILETLDQYAAASILRAVEPETRDSLLDALEAETARPLRALLAYPERTAGALMDARVKAMPADITVAEALTRLRSAPGRVLDYVYLVDREGVLVGVLNMRELMNAPAAQPVMAVARPRVAHVSALATPQTIVSHPRWRDVHALPVTDDAGRLLGAIRYGTFRRLEEEEAIERRHHHPSALVVAFVEVYWLAAIQLLPLLADVFVRLLVPPAVREREEPS